MLQPQMKATFKPIAYDWERKGRKAAAVALTRTAWDVRGQLIEGMRETFDRPTPFTMRAFRVDKATTANLEATVWAMPIQANYLLSNIEGGDRETKPFERKLHLFGGQVALPSAGAKLNQYGNMSRNFIRNVINDTNTSGGAKRFFVGTPKGWLDDGTYDGVWARVNDNHQLVRLMTFADDAEYQKRFQMSAIARKTVDDVFEGQLLRAIKSFSEA